MEHIVKGNGSHSCFDSVQNLADTTAKKRLTAVFLATVLNCYRNVTGERGWDEFLGPPQRFLMTYGMYPVKNNSIFYERCSLKLLPLLNTRKGQPCPDHGHGTLRRSMKISAYGGAHVRGIRKSDEGGALHAED